MTSGGAVTSGGTVTAPARLLLDTDIGSDVDDAHALACILGCADVQLAGITTVYGDTRVRAAIAAALCAAVGRCDVPVVPGLAEPRSGRPVWWAGYEGTGVADPQSRAIRRDLDAVDFLTSQVRTHPGTSILAIGPLTNIAAAIERDAAFASGVDRLYVMGGDFGTATAEHNFASDADAARLVFDSGIRCTVTGLEATTTVRLTPLDLAAIEAVEPLGPLLAKEATGFLALTGQDWTTPHDPMAFLPMVRPTDFTTATGRVHVSTQPADAGQATFEAADDGPVRLVTGWDRAWVRATVRGLVIAGCRRERR